MEVNSTNKSNASAMQIGILFGVLMILEFVVLYVIDIDPKSNPMVGTIMNFCNYLIFPNITIYLVCTNYKKSNYGYISFGECIKKGISACLIGGLIYVLFSVFFNYLFPEFVEDLLRKTKAVMIQNSPKMTSEELEMAMTWTKKFMNPMIMIPVTLLMYSFIGLIYSLIIGAIIKKDKPQSI